MSSFSKQDDVKLIGNGVDIAQISRLQNVLNEHGMRFCEKVFTSQEIEYCESKYRPSIHYAGRFAAKEAVFKALTTGWTKGISWKDVEVVNEVSGRPRIQLYGVALTKARELGISKIEISISHSGDYAVAQAIALSDDV